MCLADWQLLYLLNHSVQRMIALHAWDSWGICTPGLRVPVSSCTQPCFVVLMYYTDTFILIIVFKYGGSARLYQKFDFWFPQFRAILYALHYFSESSIFLKMDIDTWEGSRCQSVKQYVFIDFLGMVERRVHTSSHHLFSISLNLVLQSE